MNAWQRLAWIEWHRSTFKGEPNRDFLWLTMLLFLTLILALLLWGGRAGLLNKFVDVSVGYIEHAGIPIWLATNNVSGINRELLQNTELSQQNLTLYPYREVEWHEVALPNQGYADTGPQIWDATRVPFNGWAVSYDDPLWKMGMKNQPISTMNANDTSGLPLDIILNRSLFQQYFDCAIYVDTLQKKRLPFTLPNATAQSDNLYCLANGTLWLDIKVGRNKEYVPFHIHWQPHIPTMQNLAFLFPLSTLNTLKMVKRHANLIYYPEAQANKTTRVKRLMIWPGKEGLSDEVMDNLLFCLHNPDKKRNRLTLKRALPKTWVAACAKQNGIPLQTGDEILIPPFIRITEERESHYFQYNAEDYLTILCKNHSACQPCKTIPSLQRRLEQHVDCGDEKATIDMIAATGSYQKAFAYVETRTVLATQIEKIKAFFVPPQDSKAFYIHPTYNDALVRFMFMDKVMGILEIVYVVFFPLFFGILLWVQIEIVVKHRKHNYGIFLAKGIAGWQIHRMVFLQIGLSFLVAFSASILISELMQGLLAWLLGGVTTSKPYVDHIIASQLDLLPLSWLDYLGVGFVALVLLGAITTYLLRRLVSKRQMEPAYLF